MPNLLHQRIEGSKDNATSASRTKYQTVIIISSVAVTLASLGDADWKTLGGLQKTEGMTCGQAMTSARSTSHNIVDHESQSSDQLAQAQAQAEATNHTVPHQEMESK